jgi:hypothetical protein
LPNSPPPPLRVTSIRFLKTEDRQGRGVGGAKERLGARSAAWRLVVGGEVRRGGVVDDWPVEAWGQQRGGRPEVRDGS